MRFYLETKETELDVTIGWHSWDLSDAVLPQFAMDAADDVEEEGWKSILLHVDLNAEPHAREALVKQLEEFVEQLNKWCFEGFYPIVENAPAAYLREDITTTRWGITLNQMMDSAEDFVRTLPALTQFMRDHHDDHWREHPRLSL